MKENIKQNKPSVTIKNGADGITLIVLIITIIVLLILAGTGIQSGISSMENYQLKEFAQELEIVQAKVNVLYERMKNQEIDVYSYGKDISKQTEDIKSKITIALNGIEENDFRYFTSEDLKPLELNNIKQEIIINFKTRQVISVNGIKIKNVMYYKLEDIPNSLYNVQKNIDTQKNELPTFTLEKNIYGLKAQIQVKHIQYKNGYTSGTITYKEKGKSYDTAVKNNVIDITKTGTYEIKVTDEGGNSAQQEITVTLCNEPKLAEGMVPVKWNGENWIVTTQTDGNWYEYEEQTTDTKDGGTSRWANVMLRDGLQIDGVEDINNATLEQMQGKVVKSSGSMFVWIPRYMYKITQGYNGEDLIYENGTTVQAGNIDVKFLVEDTDMPTDESNVTVYEETGKDKWIVHPAFKDGTKNQYKNGEWDSEIEGIWVSKYEAGYAQGNNNTQKVESNIPYTQLRVHTTQEVSARNFYYPSGYSINVVDSNESQKIVYPVYLPNTYSMNLISPGDCYNISKELIKEGNPYGLKQTDADSHLLKNSEWGAVVYLTHSQYGRNGTQITVNEIDRNNIPETIYAVTGDEFVLQSSTGNIYGIYDLSGGVVEYVSAYLALGEYEQYGGNMIQKQEEQPASTKYVTVYQPTEEQKLSYETNYGDALYEVSIGTQNTTAWFSGFTQFPTEDVCFFTRGGNWNGGNNSGIFATGADKRAHVACGFRTSIIVK